MTGNIVYWFNYGRTKVKPLRLKNIFAKWWDRYVDIASIEKEFIKTCEAAQKVWEQKNATETEQSADGGQYSVDRKGSRRYNKRIKLPAVVYNRINSVRMERYARLDDADIPLDDSVTIGAQKVNTATTYYFYNIDRDNFTVYKKTKTAPKKGSEEYDINRRIDRSISRHSDNEGGNNRQNLTEDAGILSSDRRGVSVRDRRAEQDKESESHGRDSDNTRTPGRRGGRINIKDDADSSESAFSMPDKGQYYLHDNTDELLQMCKAVYELLVGVGNCTCIVGRGVVILFCVSMFHVIFYFLGGDLFWIRTVGRR
ncbi:MAG: hypothetical protein J6S13_04675 [Clostridia bacterium]|nr:hypothetical protein [Clostridia bacterium]